MMNELGPIEPRRREGHEPFRDRGRPLGFDLLDFWQWSASDLVSNTMRGVVAEYLVAQAVGVAEGSVREEWAPYDLETPDGTRIEVKSAAYIQSWRQERFSRITFRIPRTRAWDRESNRLSNRVERQADVYVFALLAHTDQPTLDPLDVSQWEFFVLPSASLDLYGQSRRSITLPSLRKLASDSVEFAGLAQAIEAAAALQRRTR